MGSRIAIIECGCLEGVRPRHAGSNARLSDHGKTVRVPIVRLTTEDGASGFGVCRANREQAEALLGQSFDALFSPETGVASAWRSFDFPLWDLAGQCANQPVYALAASGKSFVTPFCVPCYDTSLYFDDLHLSNEAEAATLIAAEAWEGYERGHRTFKIKVGRGARHMAPEAGTRRDIAVIRAVYKAVGPYLLLDANNGYNLNLTKRVLEETADCGVIWMEEAFHEDAVLYRDLKAWLAERALPIFIADGEGEASPSLLNWAREGLIDVIQYDIFGHGFSRWLETGRALDEIGARSAPHHYGGHYGNYATCHLAGALQNFTYVEWDEVSTPGLDGSTYKICDGHVCVPDAPGFGLHLDESAFQRAVAANGYCCAL